MSIPYVTHKQIAKLDELMVKHFKISVVMMMENAGYRSAEFFRQEFPKRKKILICVGKGNNGGDGIAAARHLLNFGYKPRIFLIPPQLKKEPATHLKIAKILNIPLFTSITQLKKEVKKTDVIYDCLIGYNLRGNPRGKFAEAIELMNNSKKLIVACDTPSGIDTDKGAIYSPYINASHIVFLSLPKIGCKKLKAKKFVADIGVPADLYPKIGIVKRDYFNKEEIIKL